MDGAGDCTAFAREQRSGAVRWGQRALCGCNSAAQQRTVGVRTTMREEQLHMHALLLHCQSLLVDSPVLSVKLDGAAKGKRDSAGRHHSYTQERDAWRTAIIWARRAGGQVAAAERLGGGESPSRHKSGQTAEDATGAAVASSTQPQPAVLRGEARSGGKRRVVYWGWLRGIASSGKRPSASVAAAGRHGSPAQSTASERGLAACRHGERCKPTVACISQHVMIPHQCVRSVSG